MKRDMGVAMDNLTKFDVAIGMFGEISSSHAMKEAFVSRNSHMNSFAALERSNESK